MKDGKRKILIAITSILLVILVIVGIVMLLSNGNKDNSNKKQDEAKENNRCVEGLCISKVEVEDNNGSGNIYITLKNEGETIIEKICAKISSTETSTDFCLENVDVGEERGFAYSQSEMKGNDTKDFSLEKIADSTATVNEENTSSETEQN